MQWEGGIQFGIPGRDFYAIQSLSTIHMNKIFFSPHKVLFLPSIPTGCEKLREQLDISCFWAVWSKAAATNSPVERRKLAVSFDEWLHYMKSCYITWHCIRFEELYQQSRGSMMNDYITLHCIIFKELDQQSRGSSQCPLMNDYITWNHVTLHCIA